MDLSFQAFNSVAFPKFILSYNREYCTNMTTTRKLKITFACLSTALLLTLLIKLVNIPGGMILSGLFLGVLAIVAITIVCLILTAIFKTIFKKSSFLFVLSVMTTVAFSALHYTLYSPTLHIIVPNGFTGEVNLVLSNVDDNILTLDTNGIGYLNQWTFNKIYSKPIVEQMDGKNLEKNLVGFSPSRFFGSGKSCCLNGLEIESLSFEIVGDDKIGLKQYYSTNLTTLVNKKLVRFSKPDKHTVI